MASLAFCSRAALAALSLSLLVGAGAATASAQVPAGIADCAWLKLKAKASGYEREGAADGLGKKRGPSATCYMQLAAGGGNTYTAPLVCQIDFVNWENTSAVEGYAGTQLADGNVISQGDYMTFRNAAGDVIQGYTSARIAISVGKLGEFKKATFSSFSGELTDGSMFAETPALLFGSFSVKGSTVPAEKVPEEARAQVGACP